MPDRIATARQSGEESSLREKATEAFCQTYGRTRYVDSRTQEAIEAVIAVCMEEAAKVAESEAADAYRNAGAASYRTKTEERMVKRSCLRIARAIRSLIPTSEAE